MAFPRLLLIGSIGLFVVIGVFAGVKKWKGSHSSKAVSIQTVLQTAPPPPPIPLTQPLLQESGDMPSTNRIEQLFTTGSNQLPIVETIVYESSVPWMKGRPAWIEDYASYYSTSRHFIARSLNGRANYLAQKISPGRRFNVFKKNKNFQFYLLADLSRCKMAFYYIDLDNNERVLLKTYPIGVGKKSDTASGSLTPTGRFLLGDKIAVYRPGIMGLFQDQQVEMIRVFGTRWIPFGRGIGSAAASKKGLGLHGAPWNFDTSSGRWIETRDVIGAYESNGCIRMTFEDIEELFSIVITKPTVIEIVKNFNETELPGIEVMSPKP